MPLLQGQQCQLDDGKDVCALTTTTMPFSWGWQLQWLWWQRCLHIDSNNAIMTMATTPAWQQATRATMLVEQWWRRLRIDDGNNAIMTRATIAIATMAKMSLHQQWQHHLDKGNDASLTTSNKVDNACVCTHAKEHIICLCLYAPLQTFQVFKLLSQLKNLANLSLQASLQNLPTFAVGKHMANENCCTMTFGGDMVSKMILSACAESIMLSMLPAESMILSAWLLSPLSPLPLVLSMSPLPLLS